jgi:hypothetical protein
MPRSLKTRQPRTVEVRQLHSMLEDELTARQRRRAEAIVLHAAGLEAAEIARARGPCQHRILGPAGLRTIRCR